MSKIWEPKNYKNSNLFKFELFLKSEFKKTFKDYSEMHHWSIVKNDEFWLSISKFFKIEFEKPYTNVLIEKKPFYKSTWFKNGEISYTRHLLRYAKKGKTALIYKNEKDNYLEISWNSLLEKTKKIRDELVQSNVKKGDVVVGYLLNHPDSIASFIAVNSIGAIWSCCSPDFGVESIANRFSQLNPKILLAHKNYFYGGKYFNQNEKISKLENKLKSLEKTILFSSGFNSWNFNSDYWIDFELKPVGFDHPIWVLFSSGTTGKPKAITHGTGGVLIEQYKSLSLHNNISVDDKFFWNTTTGWMMWNYSLGAILCGAILCLYDGSPNFPEIGVQWRFAKDAEINHFGNGSELFIASMKKNIKDVNYNHLSFLKTIGATGSPLSEDAFIWLQNKLPETQIISLSGGTDVCSAFIGGCPMMPVYSGYLQCKMLGAAIEAWDENGKAVSDQTGELVITKPLPSMPIYFWNDTNFNKYHDSYFKKYEGVWTHGDWIHIDPLRGIIIKGRSDATLNRNGIRIGSSEIYSALDQINEIEDSLIIDLNIENSSKLILFISSTRDVNSQIKEKIKNTLKTQCSPRHIPNLIFRVKEIPYTISGKKMEIPVKKIMDGNKIEDTISKGAMKNPDCLNEFIDIKNQYLKSPVR